MGAATTFFAPVHRVLGRFANTGNAGFPLNAAPSMDFLGNGIQDHRMAANSRGSSTKQPGVVGWYGCGDIVIANVAPSTIATNNIAAAANVVNGTAMTLVAASGAGITVLSANAPAFFMPSGLSQSSGVAIDGLPSLQVFGQGGSFQTGFYDRATYVGRGVSITGSASATGGNFLIRGFDVYGYPMSQLLTVGAGAVTANTTKTFKVVTSVTPQFTDAHNYSVGTADIFGFGMLASFFGDVSINWNNAWITANTGFVAAVTSAATTTTGDVRGTYATQSASDGTKRLIVTIAPSLSALVSNPTTGLFGVSQA